MLELLAAGLLFAVMVVLLTDRHPTLADTDQPLRLAVTPDRQSDLPCPWCGAATREEDNFCPGCGQRFG